MLPRGRAGHQRGTCYCDRGPGRIRGTQRPGHAPKPYSWDYTASYPGEADAQFESMPAAEHHINMLHLTRTMQQQ